MSLPKINLTDLSARLNNDPSGIHHNQIMSQLLDYEQQAESHPALDSSIKMLLSDAFQQAKVILQSPIQ